MHVVTVACLASLAWIAGLGRDLPGRRGGRGGAARLRAVAGVASRPVAGQARVRLERLRRHPVFPYDSSSRSMPDNPLARPGRFVVAVTGASGAIYAVRTIAALLEQGCHLDLVFSDFGRRLMHDELGDEARVEDLLPFLAARYGEASGRGASTLHSNRDLGASIASGSHPTDGMAIVPCSMKTLAGVAHGLSRSLVERAADVDAEGAAPPRPRAARDADEPAATAEHGALRRSRRDDASRDAGVLSASRGRSTTWRTSSPARSFRRSASTTACRPRGPARWFGDRQAPFWQGQETADSIAGMFDAIASRYDLLNHLLSAGLDLYWRRRAIAALRLRGGETVVDLCYRNRGPRARRRGQQPCDRPASSGWTSPLECWRLERPKSHVAEVAARCTSLKRMSRLFPSARGRSTPPRLPSGSEMLRSPDRVFEEVWRVLTSGGRFAMLEFSLPRNPVIRPLYLWYFRHILPLVGRLVSGHHSAYTYLPASVSTFPEPERSHGFASRRRIRRGQSRPFDARRRLSLHSPERRPSSGRWKCEDGTGLPLSPEIGGIHYAPGMEHTRVRPRARGADALRT